MEAEIGRFGLMEATSCLGGMFSFVRRMNKSFDCPVRQ